MASNRCPACANENTRPLKRLSPDEKVEYHRPRGSARRDRVRLVICLSFERHRGRGAPRS